MNKTFILALSLFWIVELLCIALLFIYNLLQIFVSIRNHKYLNNVFAEKKLNWFSEDGKYLSMNNRIQIQKERARITSELVNNGESQIKNLSLFRFIVKIQKIQKILLRIILVVFLILVSLHLGFVFFAK